MAYLQGARRTSQSDEFKYAAPEANVYWSQSVGIVEMLENLKKEFKVALKADADAVKILLSAIAAMSEFFYKLPQTPAKRSSKDFGTLLQTALRKPGEEEKSECTIDSKNRRNSSDHGNAHEGHRAEDQGPGHMRTRE